MKLSVKNLGGSSFQIEADLDDKVADVKMNIEKNSQLGVYPAERQMLIHQGKVLKDDTTLKDNNVLDKSVLVVMLTKNKAKSTGASSSSTATTTAPANPESTPPQTVTSDSNLEPAIAPLPTVTTPASAVSVSISGSDAYGQVASNLLAGSNLDSTIQQILDVGGGTWDRDTVVRALRAAYNNPDRAVEYLYSGIPEQTEIPPAARSPTSSQAAIAPVQASQPVQPSAAPGGPNANPLNLFPPALSNRGFDHVQNRQFQALRALVRANPQILEPMLEELGRESPELTSFIQEHRADFMGTNEPAERAEGNLSNQSADAMPGGVTVTPEEREAIARLEAMGFDRATVVQVFFACNKNEELAANYLLDHMLDFQN
ncbi:hypothetical protein J5N97_009579 [Dioscorea zingiberensis]|uniref:Ubiquitin receptor RAD23 n=1 Tax=Dioscorea zingiberensis TaxID=325984 RepID=A0A9D5CYI6_9LILI|nr:hypothetical protein J5N97_009579 [Dioscorea zingiberensis]